MKDRVTESELMVLQQISHLTSRVMELDQVLQNTLEILAEYLSLGRGWVLLGGEPGPRLELRASWGLAPADQPASPLPPGEDTAARIVKAAQPFFIPALSGRPQFPGQTPAPGPARESLACLGAPIVVHNKVVGVILVDRLFGDEVPPREDLLFLTMVAHLLGQFFLVNREVAAREAGLRHEIHMLRAELGDRYNQFLLVARSPAMREVRELVGKVAPSRASVLLWGEAGVGKSMVARTIHQESNRAKGPFVKVNCAALPEALLQSLLFGQEKGSFDGSGEARPGRVEEADGGTLFLDEVGELTLPLQAKLLRLLQEKEFERLGSTQTRRVDCRFIAATRRDLGDLAASGRFREDLYYRLNVFPITIPPLRQRREDIEPLALCFLDKYAGHYGRRLQMAPQAFTILKHYPWPGNVRELDNLMERLVIMVDKPVINLADLPSFLFHREKAGFPEPDLNMSRLEEMEKREVVAALERHHWVQSHAAGELGITLRQLGYRIKKFGLEKTVKERRRRTNGPLPARVR
ncbi:MAG: sigma 54-interacting transcriptional regulator [Deltaproteobacteria bacterium]|nr:sigma 54-interacting transcriptional regulator [Deltaproteobacteria bacterium]